MSRYFTCARPLYVETPLWPDDKPQRLSLSVPDHRPIDTGLIDKNGDTIWRSPERMGFHRP